MDLSELQHLYPIASQVSAQIIQIDHFGIHVRVDDQMTGYIKRAEALLSLRLIDLRKEFSIGQVVPAIVLGFNEKHNSLTLSFKQAQTDPWDDYVRNLEPDAVVEGEVVIITESKAIVEIQPGVTGVLAKNELWIKSDRIDDVLMVNDRIRAQILKIFAKERIILLSVRRLFADEKDFEHCEQTTYAMEESLTDALKIFKWEQEKQTEPDLVLSRQFTSQVRKIAIVDAGDAISEPMKIMLNNLGMDTTLINPTEKDALSLQAFDFVISSCIFLNDRGFIDIPILIYGSNDQYQEFKHVLEENDLISAFLPVPHSSSDFIEKLNSIVAGESQHNRIPHTHDTGQFELAFDEGVNHSFKDIHVILKKIKKLSHASFIVIFQVNLNSLETDIYAVEGAELTLQSFDKGHLQFSPISDVIIDGETVSLSHHGGLHLKYMDALGDFNSLYGIRIDFTDECGYGLFLFGEYPNQFKAFDDTFANFSEMAVRSNIEQTKFFERRCREQKFILTGKLTASLVHEIKNQLQAMQYWLEIMKTDSVNLNSGRLKGTDKAFLARFEQSINGAQRVEKRTRNVEEMFLSLLRKETMQTIHVDKFLETFIETVQPIAKKHNIQVTCQAEKNLRAHVDVSMLNQVLVNLYLNSIDFIPLVRKQTGKIELVAKKTENIKCPLCIEFSDNGPGVNEKLKEKVFELLFTSKNSGSGLGLGISRKMAEKMGGQLYIKETVRLAGTTFRLELPLIQEGHHD